MKCQEFYIWRDTHVLRKYNNLMSNYVYILLKFLNTGYELHSNIRIFSEVNVKAMVNIVTEFEEKVCNLNQIIL